MTNFGLLSHLLLLLTVIASISKAASSRSNSNVTKTPVARYTDEQRLMRAIFAGYSRELRPVSNFKKPIVVSIGLNLVQIFDLDEKNQVLVAYCWIDEEWKDENIRWNPLDFGGMDLLRIPPHFLWQPDIVLYNNADDFKVGKVNNRAMVDYEGNVFLPFPTKILSLCKIDVTYFPFDEQICKLKYGSWTYSNWKISITNRTDSVDLSNYVESGEWTVIGSGQKRNLVYYTCCEDPYSDVTFFLHLRRKPLYFIINVIFPSTIMSAMTILVFLLPSDSRQKVNLGITTLLSYSVFSLSVVQKLPETSENTPLITVYLAGVLSSTSMSVLNAVVILCIHFRPEKRIKPVPRIIKAILFERIGRAIFITEPKILSTPLSLIAMAENFKAGVLNEPFSRFVPPTQPPSSIMKDTTEDSYEFTTRTRVATEVYLQQRRIGYRKHYYHRPAAAQQQQLSTSSHYNISKIDDTFLSNQLQQAAINAKRNATSLPEFLLNNYSSSYNINEMPTSANNKANIHAPYSSSDETANRAISRSLSKLARRYAKEQKIERVLLEWQHLAMIIDRIFFVLYITVTIFVSFFLAFGPRNLQPDLSLPQA